MDLKNKPTLIERLMKKRFEELSHQELRRIRIILSLFGATAVIILGILLDRLFNTEIKLAKYIFIWIWVFLGWYILFPIISRGKIGKATKKTRTFFIVIGIVAILIGLLKIIFLLALYLQNRPLTVEGKVYPVPLWSIIINFITWLLLTIGLIYVWKMHIDKFKK